MKTTSLFTHLLALKIDLQKNKIKQNKFLILIKGGAALDLKTCPQKPFRWILDKVWLNLVEVSKLPQFTNIVNQVSKNEKNSMGARFAEPLILNRHETWEESNTRTPLICFLSMGSDPTDQMKVLAKNLQLECRAISMGQGQEVHARKLIKLSIEGGWVLLQNCHLGLELLKTITTGCMILSECGSPHNHTVDSLLHSCSLPSSSPMIRLSIV